MKKGLILLLVVALSIISLTVGFYARGAVRRINSDIRAESQLIGEEEAKSVALDKAGLTSSEVRFVKVKLDRERGKFVYEVEFKNGRDEYEADIDAQNGAILKWEKDWDD